MKLENNTIVIANTTSILFDGNAKSFTSGKVLRKSFCDFQIRGTIEHQTEISILHCRLVPPLVIVQGL